MPKLKTVHRRPSDRIKEPIVKKVDSSTQSPIFCLHHLDKDYGLSQCGKILKVSLIDKLYELSQLTWNQITNTHRHGLGLEKIPYEQIKGRMPTHITNDQDFIAIRFHQHKPVVGYRIERIFHIVWLDYNMTLYDHGR